MDAIRPPIALFYARLHGALRRELTDVSEEVLKIGTPHSGATLEAIRQKLHFLAQVYSYHSVAEDEVWRRTLYPKCAYVRSQIVYPALDAKVKNVTLHYRVEHADEGHLFVQLMQLLVTFPSTSSLSYRSVPVSHHATMM